MVEVVAVVVEAGNREGAVAVAGGGAVVVEVAPVAFVVVDDGAVV